MRTLGSFGRFLVSEGYVDQETLVKAYALQKERKHLRIGEILVGTGVLSYATLVDALDIYRSCCKIGEILLMNGKVTRIQLEVALDRQPKSGSMLGKILMDMGACQVHDVIEALAVQRRERSDTFGQEVAT